MKLKDLIEEYGATGFVLQDAGNGSATDNGRFVNVDDGSSDDSDALLAEYGDVELVELAEEHISDDNVKCQYGSEWIIEGTGDNPYRVRIFF